MGWHYQWSNTYNHATNVLGTDSFYTIKPQVGSTAFTLVGWNALGCNDTITRQVSTSICNGIESLNDNTELTIMPNPTTGIFVMEYRSTVYGKLKITLRSMNGHLAFETESNKRNDLFRYEYNGSNLSRGIYILTVTINNKGINRRVVLK